MNNLIPFGKYKGQPIEAIQEDKQYIDWLLAQSWFREKHQDFYTVIINNFQEATETPEHNAMHVKFLDDDYVLDMLGKYKSELKDFFVIGRIFEYRGWDVAIHLSNYSTKDLEDQQASIEAKLKARIEAYGYNDDFYNFCYEENIDENDDFFILSTELRKLKSSVVKKWFHIEIKPTVSDDFPAVLRQIKNRIHENKILLLGEYTGIGATQEQFIAFMKNENITVIFA